MPTCISGDSGVKAGVKGWHRFAARVTTSPLRLYDSLGCGTSQLSRRAIVPACRRLAVSTLQHEPWEQNFQLDPKPAYAALGYKKVKGKVIWASVDCASSCMTSCGGTDGTRAAAVAAQGSQHSTVNDAMVFASLALGLLAGGLGNWAADNLPSWRRAALSTGQPAFKLRLRGRLLYVGMVAAFATTAWLLGPDPRTSGNRLVIRSLFAYRARDRLRAPACAQYHGRARGRGRCRR